MYRHAFIYLYYVIFGWTSRQWFTEYVVLHAVHCLELSRGSRGATSKGDILGSCWRPRAVVCGEVVDGVKSTARRALARTVNVIASNLSRDASAGRRECPSVCIRGVTLARYLVSARRDQQTRTVICPRCQG